MLLPEKIFPILDQNLNCHYSFLPNEVYDVSVPQRGQKIPFVEVRGLKKIFHFIKVNIRVFEFLEL